MYRSLLGELRRLIEPSGNAIAKRASGLPKRPMATRLIVGEFFIRPLDSAQPFAGLDSFGPSQNR